MDDAIFYKIILGIVGFLVSVSGFLVVRALKRYDDDISELKQRPCATHGETLSKIGTDIEWIKQSLQTLQSKRKR